MTINQMVVSPFDILRQAQDDIVMVSLSNHQGDNSGLLQEPYGSWIMAKFREW